MESAPIHRAAITAPAAPTAASGRFVPGGHGLLWRSTEAAVAALDAQGHLVLEGSLAHRYALDAQGHLVFDACGDNPPPLGDGVFDFTFDRTFN